MKTLLKSKIVMSFTLIELMAAMGVFAIIMLIVMSIFTSANKAWKNCRDRSEVYENARVAMDLISRDIQCIYYEYEKIPFYHYPGSSTANDNEALFFVSATSIGPSATYSSKICEIAYSFYNQDDLTASCKAGWLVRSATADNNPAKWNYYNKPAVQLASETPYAGKVFDMTDATYAFTQNSNSREAYAPVIPNVVDLSFICLKKDGNLIDKTTNPKMFPYSVIANLTLLDSNSWAKWKAIAPTVTITDPDAQGTGESTAAWELRKNNQRKFSKTVIIGEKDQQY
jgi:type II secretory pathway pseudopilin PulG